MFHANNYLNRPMFHGVIQKRTLAQFFETRCVCEKYRPTLDSLQSKIFLVRIAHYRPATCRR